jgi:hypothetical protein
MGTLDDLTATFGDGVLRPRPDVRAGRENWCELCVCGHIDRYHSADIGGAYVLPEERTKADRDGAVWTFTQRFTGCAGALPPRGVETESLTRDEENLVVGRTVNATCPCTEFRPVVKVDRPNRMFNQRIPTDRSDHTRHPFVVGIRAYTTFLSKLKAAKPETGGSPEWATAEFERRFTWLDGARTCSISRCTTTGDGVWPCFVNGEALSELRCGSHRPS